MNLEIAFFALIAIVAILAASMVIVARNPVHSALFLVLTLFSVAVLFLTLGAEFLAAVQILVYAGAIMVLFLFVITLLNPSAIESPDRLQNQNVYGGALALALLIEIALVLRSGLFAGLPATAPPLAYESNVQAVGLALYTTYLVPFEATSILLLIAMVGAVVLARGRSR